jgi:ankyrin repeat protein
VQLAKAQLAVAREHGFTSWRALKAEIEKRQKPGAESFFDAAEKGDVTALGRLLTDDPALIRATRQQVGDHGGWTALHAAASKGHADAVRLLLERGADPNAREEGDNSYPLHWAAAAGHLDVMRALLDAGTDVHGRGDAHELEVIGWAAFFHGYPGAQADNPAAISLLLERGARHNIISAIMTGDLDGIREVVARDPRELGRHTSRYDGSLSPLHLAMNRKRYDIMELLIQLGADVEMKDGDGKTALEIAMLRGDREAMSRLYAAGARPLTAASARRKRGADLTKLANTVTKTIPMVSVPDVGAALDWYASIGFKELNRLGHGRNVGWGIMALGKAQIMFRHYPARDPEAVSLWFYTNKVRGLYELLKERQLEAARAALGGGAANARAIEFVQDLRQPPGYGKLEFWIRDLNGYVLCFLDDGTSD